MKVLIVDDSDLLQSRLKKALFKVDQNMSISQASNCEQALELFQPFKPDTVILDIALPDGSGIDLLRKFKENNPDVNVIVFTNYPTPEFKRSCIELGATSFIDKSNINSLLLNLIH
jgi:DNA-binding NarL/FixJ family response regulator